MVQYAGAAMATGITCELGLAETDVDGTRRQAELTEFVKKLENRIVELESTGGPRSGPPVLEQRTPDCSLAPITSEESPCMEFIENKFTRVFHRLQSASPVSTGCGWKPVERQYKFVPGMPAGSRYLLICSRCGKAEREVALAGEDSEND